MMRPSVKCAAAIILLLHILLLLSGCSGRNTPPTGQEVTVWFQNNEEDVNTVRDYLATLDFDSMEIRDAKVIVGYTYIIGYTYISESTEQNQIAYSGRRRSACAAIAAQGWLQEYLLLPQYTAILHLAWNLLHRLRRGLSSRRPNAGYRIFDTM